MKFHNDSTHHDKSKGSFTGRLSRETIRFLMHLPMMQGDGKLIRGARLSDHKSHWRIPEGYSITKIHQNGLPLELLSYSTGPKEKILLHLHGGAYVIGFIDFYRKAALRYSHISGRVSVLSVDYRTAPEHTFPAALDDAYTAWNWILLQGFNANNIIIIGDSAGGNLALALTARLRDEGKALPGALVLMSPWTDMVGSGPSRTYNLYNDPLFGLLNGPSVQSEKIRTSVIDSYAGDTNLYNPYVSPVYGSFKRFPPMLLQVGTFEVLESDSILVFEKAVADGVDVRLSRYEGMFHMFQFFAGFSPEGKQAWHEIEEFLSLHI